MDAFRRKNETPARIFHANYTSRWKDARVIFRSGGFWMRVGVSDSSRPGDTPRGKISSSSSSTIGFFLLSESCRRLYKELFFGFCGQKESLENTQTEIKYIFVTRAKLS